MILLGIDPGSRRTGYGIIDVTKSTPCYIASGFIRIDADDLSQRLAQVYAGISELIASHRPAEVAIERVFVAKNPDSALKLGQARGSAIVCAANHGLPVFEYAATLVKQAVTGSGGADKPAVQRMVASTLKLNGLPQADAADALAIALTHCFSQRGMLIRGISSAASRHRGGRNSWRSFRPE